MKILEAAEPDAYQSRPPAMAVACRDVEAATLVRDGSPPITRTTFPTCRAMAARDQTRWLPRHRAQGWVAAAGFKPPPCRARPDDRELYSIGQTRPIAYDEYWQVPAYMELRTFGMSGVKARPHVLWFLHLMDLYASWKGKLVIRWPPPELSWWRRAHRNVFPIYAIPEDSALDAAMPSWDQIDLGWDELSVMPSRWRAVLSQWRGIYYIYDQACGKGYVGSAYADTNVLGRWLNYAASGRGGNILLRRREKGQVARQPDSFTPWPSERICGQSWWP